LLSFHRLLLLCLPLTSAVVINCDFEMSTWYAISKVYQCKLNKDPQITSPGVKVTAATGSHISSSMTHASVRSFFSDSASYTINYFPRGLNDVFPNLEAIGIAQSKMIELHQSDLSPFTKLRLLGLWQNNIKTLEKDLFKYNPELEAVYVFSNKITSFYPTVFDRLEKLTGLHLHGNECVTDGRVDANRQDVLALIEKVKKQCSPTVEKIDKIEQDLMEFRQRSENQSLVMQKQSDENIRNSSSTVVEAIKDLQAEMNQKLTVIQEKQEQLDSDRQRSENHSTVVERDLWNLTSAVERLRLDLKSKEQVSFLTFITEKEPLFFFVALPSVLLLTVLNVLVIFACLKRGEKKKKEEEECVAGAAEEGVELREMREGEAA
jgi:uncharacterized protein (UPF0305 family)